LIYILYSAYNAIDSCVILPYWDWTKDNKIDSPIWDEDFIGGNGRDEGNMVMTGPFAYDAGKWNLNINDEDELNPRPYLRRGLAKFPGVLTLQLGAFLAWPNYMTHGEDALRKNMKKVE
jgi:tyrosinase